jgi:hypothetical protein
MDCKVIPGETVVAQHQLLVADISMRGKLGAGKNITNPRIRWGYLKGERIAVFREKVLSGRAIER